MEAMGSGAEPPRVSLKALQRARSTIEDWALSYLPKLCPGQKPLRVGVTRHRAW
jgi:hypothetical protein